ncbi:glycosyltransferase, partial [bacterium]|nr:glycosyltransferase [bacterium]
MPVYNAAETLEEALGSIAGQSFGDFEVVAVDDGS